MPNKVWIELDRTSDPADNIESARLATNMLKKLGGETMIHYNESKEMYEAVCIHSGTYKELADNGEWFNLDYLGRDE